MDVWSSPREFQPRSCGISRRTCCFLCGSVSSTGEQQEHIQSGVVDNQRCPKLPKGCGLFSASGRRTWLSHTPVPCATTESWSAPQPLWATEVGCALIAACHHIPGEFERISVWSLRIPLRLFISRVPFSLSFCLWSLLHYPCLSGCSLVLPQIDSRGLRGTILLSATFVRVCDGF